MPVPTFKNTIYRIACHLPNGNDWYLTRDGENVGVASLNKRTSTQLWIVKPDTRIRSAYSITSFENPDLSLNYRDSDMHLVVNARVRVWTLDTRGSAFVIGDLRNEKAMNLDSTLGLQMKARTDNLDSTEHNQRWTFIEDDTSNIKLPPGLDDWRNTTLENGIYYVDQNQWAIWLDTGAPISRLVTWPRKQIISGDDFYARMFLFIRNDDGTYYISNWIHYPTRATERFLHVDHNGKPAVSVTKNKCYLFRVKSSDTYVVAMPSTSGSDDPTVAVCDPSPAQPANKPMEDSLFGSSLDLSAGVKWRIVKDPQ